MRYIKLAFQYMGSKHYWKLALMVLVPSIVISIFNSFGTTADYIVHFFDYDTYDFASVHSRTSELTWWSALILIGVCLVLAILLSVYIGTMQRHMRTGRFAITNIFKRINEHFLPSVFTIATIFVMVYLYGLGMTISVTLWYLITKNATATFALTIVSMVLLFLAMIYIICIFSMVTPHIVVTGSRFKDAVLHSLHVTHDNIGRLYLAFALPVVLLLAFQFAFVWCNIRIVHIVIDSLTMLFIGCYYPVLIFVAYYDINDKDREDLLPVNKL